MILLDTNVLSALMRPEPEQEVVAWLNTQSPELIWTSSVTVFEIRFGLEILADGRRRRFLEQAFAKALEEDLENRIALFDLAAAQAAGRMAAERRKAGRPVEIRDMQIAGIAKVHDAAVATRNVRDFEGLGLTLVDPWSKQG
jgi:toxin FitB